MFQTNRRKATSELLSSIRSFLFGSAKQAPAMPTCMDRLGDMVNLVTLKISQNKLRSLPSRYDTMQPHGTVLR